jgi:hypothetical protein
MVQKNERVELEMKIMKDRGAMARRVTDTAPAFVGVMTSSYDLGAVRNIRRGMSLVDSWKRRR